MATLSLGTATTSYKPLVLVMFEMSAELQSVSLSAEQGLLVDFAIDGVNLFYTGKAGSGKTLVLRKISKCLQHKFGEQAVAITATTGIAATQIGGQTIHSWAGIGVGFGSRYQLLHQVNNNLEASQRWKKCKALIVDEVSMMNRDVFEALEFISRKVRANEERFGGIQLIFCGDFYQLPPVVKLDTQKEHAAQGDDRLFCFSSRKWNECIDAKLKLTHVYRQSDPELLLLLDELRKGGQLSATAHHLLEKVQLRRGSNFEGPETLFLYPHRIDVEKKNREILQQRDGPQHVSIAKDTSSQDGKINDCPYPSRLVYNVGARVMLLKNMHREGLANGSIGEVVSVTKDKPTVRFGNGKIHTIEKSTWAMKDDSGVVIATRRQFPLTLAWALTIHKSQGQTIENVVVSLKGIFDFGQAYVALSRACSLSGLRVYPDWDHTIPVDPGEVYQKVPPG